MRLVPAVKFIYRRAVRKFRIGEFTVPEGWSVSVRLTPNPHVDPLRLPVRSDVMRCPFDVQGVDRRLTGHDGFDFNPDRWLDEAERMALGGSVAASVETRARVEQLQNVGVAVS